MGRMAGSRGNALHQLQAFVHPHVKHVITQTFRAEDVEDSGDPDGSYIIGVRQSESMSRRLSDQMTRTMQPGAMFGEADYTEKSGNFQHRRRHPAAVTPRPQG